MIVHFLMNNRDKLLIIVFLLVIAGIFNEWGYKLADSMVFHRIGYYDNGEAYNIYLQDSLYYFINSLFVFMWPLTVFYLLYLLYKSFDIKDTETKKQIIWSSIRALSSIPVFWFGVEVIENYCFLMKINSDALKVISDGGVWQIMFTLCMSGLVTFGLIKYKS